MVYIGKKYKPRNKRKDKMIRSAMEIRRRIHWMLDSKNRMCQKISDNNNRKELCQEWLITKIER
jgi:hypothetical protein